MKVSDSIYYTRLGDTGGIDELKLNENGQCDKGALFRFGGSMLT